MSSLDKMLTVKQYADKIGVDRQTVYYHLEKGNYEKGKDYEVIAGKYFFY